MRGLLADVNIQGLVDDLIQLATSEPRNLFWTDLNLTYLHFDDIGLAHNAADSKIWEICQREGLILITDNRNQDDADSLEATIRLKSTAESLPIFTISSIAQLRASRHYADRVVEKMIDFLSRIEDLRGTGRLYLP